MDYVHIRLLPVIFLSFLCVSEVSAGLIVHESFSYAPGARTGNGGFGWKQAWGSDPMATTNQGLQFTDSLGDSLQVSGNASTRMSGGSAQIEAVRDLQTELADTFWFSFLVNGIGGSHTVSVGLNQSVYIGQGAKDVTSAQWGVYDTDKALLGSGGNITQGQSVYFVGRAIYNQANDKFTDLDVWMNPVLSVAPQISDPSVLYSGSVKEFDKVPKIAVYHTNTAAAVDELRFGDAFADVAPFTSGGGSLAVPEPPSFLFYLVLLPVTALACRGNSGWGLRCIIQRLKGHSDI